MIQPRHIIQATADRYEIKLSDILGPSKHRVFAWPRQTAMYLCRELNGEEMSFPRIGLAFKSRSKPTGLDHSTVVYGYNAVRKRLTDSKASRELEADCRAIAVAASAMQQERNSALEAKHAEMAFHDFMAEIAKQNA